MLQCSNISRAVLRQNRTPSAKARSESELFQTPHETPRSRKRKRQAAQLADLMVIDEGSGTSEDEEGGEEKELTEERRMAHQVYETTWRLGDHKDKQVKLNAHIMGGSDNVYEKVKH